MRRVYFSRDERGDPLVLARDAINEAIFRREAEALGLPVHEEPDLSGEDNTLCWYAEVIIQNDLERFLTALRNLGMPLLEVVVPAAELRHWHAHALNADFSFDVPGGV